MTLAVLCLIGLQLFLAGLPWLLVIGGGALGALALWLTYLAFPHVTQRIDRFLDPAGGDNYQVGLGLQAIQGAAWFGSGPGEGTVKCALPDAHSDFVFAVIAEEFGLIASLALLGLFAFVLLRGLARTEAVGDRFALHAPGGGFPMLTGVRQHGDTVWLSSLTGPAIARAYASGRPAVIHVNIDPKANSEEMPKYERFRTWYAEGTQ